jgi:hypothetical protein
MALRFYNWRGDLCDALPDLRSARLSDVSRKNNWPFCCLFQNNVLLFKNFWDADILTKIVKGKSLWQRV